MKPLSPQADAELAALMARVEAAAFFAGMEAEGEAEGDVDAESNANADADGRERMAREGWLLLESVVEAGERRRLAGAIEALRGHGIPPLFVYAYDETWQIGARVVDRLSRALGERYALLPDVWAFRVAPGPEHGGWAPHRGSYQLAPDRSAPELLNVWVALTDATLDNACMHLVPLDQDPAYPDDLRSHAAAARATPLPVRAGTALAWNANVLHSGGRSSERARGPRISMTFTLRRADAAGGATSAHLLDLARLDHRARLDLLADQVLIYGDLDPTLPDVVRRWARITVGLRERFSFSAPGSPRKAP